MDKIQEQEQDRILLEGVERELYDFKDEEKESDFYRIKEGLTEDIVRQISKEKNDPEWMLEFRLKSLALYNKIEVPDWGPPIDGLNMDNIATYVRSKSDMKGSWEEVPEDIKNAFEKLGIPQAERESLAGVGAQYDSELVYHNVREDVAKSGVVYTDMESALTGEYEDMVKEHF
ncbi:MAG: Fe-S cluster assembly protein SufB, partial [Lachnospiraceae bacterium]|nr:Fe-S cluster assembly protein SufB [Lachnospiraceae bacterium]